MAHNKIEFGGKTLIDLTSDTVVKDALVVGYTAHGADGEPVAGANPYEKAATDTTVQTQADLIDQIKTALEGKAVGGVELPELDNPGSADDLAMGKQLIGQDGSVVTGNILVFPDYLGCDVVEEIAYDDGEIDITSPPANSRMMLDTGGKLRFHIPGDLFGNAKPENVAQGVIFTSSNGVCIEGTAVMGGGATVKTATATPTANGTSLTFTGLTGHPKMFSICPTGNVTFNTQNRFVVNVMYDGTTTQGIYAVSSGSWNATYTGTHSATYFKWAYTGDMLIINTESNANGGYFAANVTYQLTYAV